MSDEQLPDESEPDDRPDEIKSSKEKDRISLRQERVAACLARGDSVSKAGRECRVADCTIWGWKRHQPAFNARVEEISREMTSSIVRRLADLMSGGADGLEALLKSKSEAARLAAINAIFGHFSSITNTLEIKGQLAQLLQQLDAAEGKRNSQ